MATANPWDPASGPSPAGLLLGHFVASGLVNQVSGGNDGVIKGAGWPWWRQNLAVRWLVVPTAGVLRVLLGVCTRVKADRASSSLQPWLLCFVSQDLSGCCV